MQALTRNPLADPGSWASTPAPSAAVVLADPRSSASTASTGYVWFAFAGAAVASVAGLRCSARAAPGATPERLALAGAALSAALLAVRRRGGAAGRRRRFDRLPVLDRRLAGRPRTCDVVARVLPFSWSASLLALGARPVAERARARRGRRPRAGRQPGRTRVLGIVAITLLCGAATAAVRADRLRRAGRAARRPRAHRPGPALAAAVLAGARARPAARSPTCSAGWWSGPASSRSAGHRVPRRAGLPVPSSAPPDRRRCEPSAASSAGGRVALRLDLRTHRASPRRCSCCRALVAAVDRRRHSATSRSRSPTCWHVLAGGGTAAPTGSSCYDLRLPRLVLGLLVGAALALAGAVFQSLSRNPLGSPDIVGFTTGRAVRRAARDHRCSAPGRRGSAAGAIVGGLLTAPDRVRAGRARRRGASGSGSSWSASGSAPCWWRSTAT